MKKITKVFIIVELLDIITTLIGIYLYPYLIETNPIFSFLGENWYLTVLIKSSIIMGVAIVLEKRKKWSRFVWVIPTIATFPVISNIANIVAETVMR
jgi:hypothetical protein